MARHLDVQDIQAALIGYLHQLKHVEDQISEIKRRLGTRAASTVLDGRRPQKKHHRISPEGRARIAAAQRNRWAKAKKAA